MFQIQSQTSNPQVFPASHGLPAGQPGRTKQGPVFTAVSVMPSKAVLHSGATESPRSVAEPVVVEALSRLVAAGLVESVSAISPSGPSYAASA